ncbi:MAG: hypothetical protein ACK55Z_23995 [bacterium]
MYGPIILGSLMRSIFSMRHSSLCVQIMVSLRAGVKTYSEIISVKRTASMLVVWSPFHIPLTAEPRIVSPFLVSLLPGKPLTFTS